MLGQLAYSDSNLPTRFQNPRGSLPALCPGSKTVLADTVRKSGRDREDCLQDRGVGVGTDLKSTPSTAQDLLFRCPGSPVHSAPSLGSLVWDPEGRAVNPTNGPLLPEFTVWLEDRW